ncbi:MAG TPA: glycine cleavage system protein H [Bacteroidota bacterium]|nr:glycine cleavage system protein H [Bacteroidota bacterium]
MSIILAVTAAIIALLIGRFRYAGHSKKVERPVLVRRYIHPGHAWVRETEDGDVLVGIDEFAQALIGTIDSVELPRLLKKVEQGSVAWRLRHGLRTVPIVAPVSGRVIEKNEMVLNNPSLVNRAPYGDGWLLRIKPRRLPSQLRNLLTGKSAQQWTDAVRSQLIAFFSGTPALMYQDGGVLLTDLSDRCSDEEWERLVREFFLVEKSTINS